MKVISTEKLSKQYFIKDSLPYMTLRDSLSNLFKPQLLIKQLRQKPDTFWALKDVTFSLEEGEILGILGNNGAGKSTLLKILSRVTTPTYGSAQIRGRLGSLLEVGTGFHPELTARENIYLYGAILGMTRKEINSQFEAIVDFAEVERFLETPLKFFSSGMYMRLAFSVAAHLQSEIILIDEVLAVGDIEFQKKCLGKMGDIARQGRTILFVSHNMGAVQQLCTRAIVMEKGKLVYEGSTRSAIEKYVTSFQASEKVKLSDRQRSSQVTGQALITSASIAGDKGKPLHFIESDQGFMINLEVNVKEAVKTGVWLSIKDENLRPVSLLSSGHLRGKQYQFKPGKYRVSCRVAPTHLTSGRYAIDCGLLFPNRETVDLVNEALFFSVNHLDPYSVGFEFSQQFAVTNLEHDFEVSTL